MSICALLAPTETDPCNPSPCGPNSRCDNGLCSCLPEFFGDATIGCRPECLLNGDCSRDLACRNNKCRDPCPGTCASNAICQVINHIPMCSCPQGFQGNAFAFCNPVRAPITSSPCNPSPCGPNSQCRDRNGISVCTCVPGYLGNPPNCRPECLVSTDCSPSEACINQKCRNPCVGICGIGARCEVINHNPICQCPPRYSGDPFIRCQAIRKKFSFSRGFLTR